MQNVGALKREVPAVLKPRTVEDVQALVKVANTHGAALYPVSTGKNWGVGSKLPVRDGGTIVDLSGLNRIRGVSVSGRYAIIEPGVTQRQLFEELRANGWPLFFDVTGSSADTSIVGNLLDRGVGYFACRFESLLGLEIVLGNGTLVRTGFWHVDGAKTAHLFRYGVGPYLDGLFTQSNYGIVTAVAFALLPLPEIFSVFWCRLASEDRLRDLVEGLAVLRRENVVRSVVHIADRNRMEATLGPLLAGEKSGSEPQAGSGGAFRRRMPLSAWSAAGSLFGTRRQVAAMQKDIRKRLRHLCDVKFLSEGRLKVARFVLTALSFLPPVRRFREFFDAVEPLRGLARGIPTDAAMASVHWPLGRIPNKQEEILNPDRSDAGLLYCVPVIPFDGAEAVEAVRMAREVCAAHDFQCFITLNTMTDHALEGVINIAFERRDPDACKRAHRCIDEMLAAFARCGLPPYRLGIQHMGDVTDDRDSFWTTVRDLKRSLDPNNIIAPCRYNLV